MADLVLCEPTELYNILNQVTKLSRLAEPNYLCLLDVRSKREYDESHVITAIRVKKRGPEFLMLESVDLECVRYCVVYDSNTSSLEVPLKDGDDEDDEDNADSEDSIHGLASGAAVQYARLLAHLTRHPILILKGGYERFSARYHFFQTQKIIWMPQLQRRRGEAPAHPRRGLPGSRGVPLPAPPLSLHRSSSPGGLRRPGLFHPRDRS